MIAGALDDLSVIQIVGNREAEENGHDVDQFVLCGAAQAETLKTGDGKGLLLYPAKDKMMKPKLNLHSSEYFDELERRKQDSELENSW